MEAPPVREGSDLSIIPVTADRIVIQRRPMLQDEVCLRRAFVGDIHREDVVLGRQDVVSSRESVEPPPSRESIP